MNNHEIPIHEGFTQTQPGIVGFRMESIDNLDNLFLRLIKDKKLQCASYLLSKDGLIFASKSMGKLCGFEENGDLMPDSIRNIASITKIFTAIAILQLVEKGYIYMSQPVSSIISEFDTPVHQSITIFHLLTHTSGITPDAGFFQEPYPVGWRGNAKDGNWIKAGLSGPVIKKPGEEWLYSSFGFLVLGEIISRISGIPYEEYVVLNIIQPMGLNNTFFDVPEALCNKVCLVSKWERKYLHEQKEDSNRPPKAAGGLYSSLEDLQKLGQLMLNKGTINGSFILGRKTVETMISNNIAPGTPAFHWGDQFQSYEQGLGWRVTSRNIFSSPGTFGHEGAGRSSLYIDPVEQFVAAVFVPTEVSWVPESIVGAQGVIWSGII